MPYLSRDEISWNERYRRCLYHFLRNKLDGHLLNESLIRSYGAFKAKGGDYPFVEMRELKPRARIVAPEYPEQSHFILIFCEDSLPPDSKRCICFFDTNKITKENLCNLANFDLKDVFHYRMRFFDDKDFANLLRHLLASDFAVLVQRDPTVKARYRYALSHFHVRIDWPVAEAAADLGQYLRYISRDLYEKGDKEAEVLLQKLYEYHGFHHMVGGRRTAALAAAQYLTRFDFNSTVYVSSAEARTLFRLSKESVSKYVLIRIPREDVEELANSLDLTKEEFISSYLIDKTPDHGVGIFLVTYTQNEHSLPPMDGKIRQLQHDRPWLKVDRQLLVPPPSNGDARPIPYSRVYL
ncbi:hypothetical protein ACFL2Q_02955 [Thermodesulfobacteriota bacterium]